MFAVLLIDRWIGCGLVESGSALYVFRLRVKFYTTSPTQLVEEITRLVSAARCFC